MADEIDVAVVTLAEQRNLGAQPLVFSEEASVELSDRTDGQLRSSVPNLPGGLAAAEPTLRRAALLAGQVAKALMLFHKPDATEIDVQRAREAREIAEIACRLRLSDLIGKPPAEISVRDGAACED